MDPHPNQNLAATIEAILFWSAEPKTVPELAAATGAEAADVEAALEALAASLAGRGVTLVQSGAEAALATAPEAAATIEKLRRDELSRELTKSALETLTAVAYAGPLARAEIDYLRGVNSQYALRSLSLRGLVAREEQGPDRGRYRATPELLAHMGVASPEALPGYRESRQALRDALQASAEADQPAQAGAAGEPGQDPNLSVTS